ncbi:PREDICTED: testis-expressed sequence 2 protein-like [Camelina sativa]|uniref:Testis-expressed sequence 2 protein-like n=1 Tax=Camelina sativa TaxID=90675 RepID=A0ABM0WPQ2_CAMSA|nr:PREDICTED: testis-expressed sequence 2 protein-like [Camelina sativa]
MVSFAGFAFVFGFLLGILAIVAAEVIGFLFVLKRLNRKSNKRHESNSGSDPTLKNFDPRRSIDFSLSKQGVIWILEMDENVKDWMKKDKLPKEQKKKRVDLMEVHPIRRFARIKDHKLILSDSDGTQTCITLKGCFVNAVSGSGPTRKWAKRFPIQVESKTSVLYKGNRVFYIFLETSWEKESWCKALRLAACENQERFIWSTKLKDEFRHYLASLNAAYPSFMKPSAGFSFESLDKGIKVDGPSSKVRLFWKKFSKKCSPKVNMPPSGREDKKTSTRPYQDSQSTGGSGKSTPARRMQDNIPEETDVQVVSRSWSHSSHGSDIDSEDKSFDEGTLALNVLISRLFFDVKQNTVLKTLVRERIQRVMSNMRIPSYIGELICCDVDIGNLPPYIHGTRILPMEMNGVWAFELDIEYTGGAGLEVETRVDAREEELQKGIAEGKLQPNSAGDVSPGLLEGLADFEKQLIPEGIVDAQDVRNGGNDKTDEYKGLKGTKAAPSNGSKWKSILKNIAEQVSQVPITLSIGVSSLRGTLCVHMKPPPSDQLWFGFTNMPDIEFNLASAVGEHKITNSHVAMFLVNRFKTAIREVMVLPNCESLTIPWMTAEKDDWIERNIAPFMWLNQDSTSDHEAAEAKSKADKPPTPEQMQKTANVVPQKPRIEEVPVSAPSADSTALTIESQKSLDELQTPLLESSEKQDTVARGGNGNAGDILPRSIQSPSMSFQQKKTDKTEEESQ